VTGANARELQAAPGVRALDSFFASALLGGGKPRQLRFRAMQNALRLFLT
jgi:hypothetical protein